MRRSQPIRIDRRSIYEVCCARQLNITDVGDNGHEIKSILKGGAAMRIEHRSPGEDVSPKSWTITHVAALSYEILPNLKTKLFPAHLPRDREMSSITEL